MCRWRSTGPLASARWRWPWTDGHGWTTALTEFGSSGRFGSSWPSGDLAPEPELLLDEVLANLTATPRSSGRGLTAAAERRPRLPARHPTSSHRARCH